MTLKRYITILIVVLLLPIRASAAQVIDVGFSGMINGKTAEQVVVDAINMAHKSLYIASYQLTNKRIVSALIDARKRGVEINLMLDTATTSTHQSYGRIAMRYSTNTCYINSAFKIMHHKFIVVDNDIVETGSFNFTRNAAKRNAENAILIRDKATADAFLSEWHRIYTIASHKNDLYSCY